jgi:hypothetical protein
MISQSQNDPIDLDLVDKVIEMIPSETWSAVIDAIVGNIVDNMPSTVVERLTGTIDNFDRAEEILLDYYRIPLRKHDLIVDAFKIIGPENTLYLLDSLQLDKYAEIRNQSIDNAPCSLDPQ